MKGIPWALGMLFGLLVGLLVGYGVWKGTPAPHAGPSDRIADRVVAAPRTVATPEEVERAKALQEEVDKLRDDVAGLTRDLAVAREKLAQAAPKPAPKPTVPAGVDQAKHRDAAKKTLQALAKMGLADLETAEGQKMLKDLSADLEAAGDLGFSVLEEALQGKDSTGRFLTILALEGMDKERALPIMTKALHEDSAELVRRMASQALATTMAERALPDLEQAMREDKDWGVRTNCAYGLASQGKDEGVGVLVDCYKDTSHSGQERLAVLAAIGTLAPPSTAGLFEGLLSTSRDDSTLFVAIGAVQKMKDKSALAALQAIIQADGYAMEKDAAKKAYNTIYGQEVYR